MAVSIPSDLIRQIQSRLRERAGVPSYDPADPAFRFLPPADEAIWGLDPAALPCPKFISFNTTEGYRKLLKSLVLNGSEIVLTNTKSKDSRKDRSVEDGVALSDYLNIELSRSSEEQEEEKSSSADEPARSTYTLNLTGIDLDDYFSDAKKETATEKATEPENLDAFSSFEKSVPSADPLGRDPFGEHLPENDSTDLRNADDLWPLDDLWHATGSTVAAAAKVSEPPAAQDHDLRPVGSSSTPVDDDSYDDWQDFTGSTNAPDSSSNVLREARSEMIAPSASSSRAFDDAGFGSFFPFGEDSNDQRGMQPPDLFAGGMNGWDETTVAPPGDPKATVDSLLSQMHDLSFMLEDGLSVPGKPQPSDRAS